MSGEYDSAAPDRSEAGTILLVDADPSARAFLAAVLGRAGYVVLCESSPEAAIARLDSDEVDLVLTDIELPGARGVAFCERLRAEYPHVPVIIVTAFGDVATAVQAIRAGAFDFLMKPPVGETVVIAVRRALEHRRLHDELRRLRRERATPQAESPLLGSGPAMRRLRRLLERVADSDVPVLITGESGTGKELAAQVLHQRSRRCAGPFVAVNCAALNPTLLESELFGHVRGAFTDAHTTRAGLFLQASGGTLFLDEIGEIPLALQPKLLRALQERRVRPVGADGEVQCDVRVICATNADLEHAVNEGRFRPDLFFRINVVRVHMPPLRERGSDVLLLAQRFLERAADRAGKRVLGFSPAVAACLLAHPWPGNVRELENCIEQAVVLTRWDELHLEDLPERVRQSRSVVLPSGSEDHPLLPLAEVERRHVLRALDAAGHNMSVAARTLGLDRKTLYRKLERWGLRQ